MTQPSQDKSKSIVAAGLASLSEPRDLFGQTVRTVVILVGACVLFVGSLSAAAVAITSKAMGASSSPSTAEACDSKPAAAPKKPLSI